MANLDSNLNIHQETALRQRLVPAQVMFGQYLEMNAPELEEEIRRAVDENPALEIAEHDRPVDTEQAAATSEADYSEDDENEDDLPSYRLSVNNRSADDPVYEPLAVDDRMSLSDWLESQLGEYSLNEVDTQIARFIIGNLDDNGYLTRGYAQIADDMAIGLGLDIDAAAVRRVAAVVRRMDPAGVCAVDLRDCLLMQLERPAVSARSGRVGSTAVADAALIVRDFFDLFSARKFDRLAQRSGLDRRRVADALALIKTLNPKPGATVQGPASDDRLGYIVPDFHVDIDGDGRATVSLGGNIPDLAIAESFRLDGPRRPQASGAARGRQPEVQAHAFIKSRHDDAAMLISVLNSRSQTLIRVMKAIVMRQRPFFESGQLTDIRPLVLREIAEDADMDLSVVSRATNGKYFSTPRGVWPVKVLFNEARTDNPETSVHEIVDALKHIIDNEDKLRPLTDEAIRALLAEKGYSLARRTVTKYREQLGLPSGRLRRGM